MNVIIPLGGIGARFQNEGYSRPKPLIHVLGKPMIFHVIDNLKLSLDDIVYIIYNGDLDRYNFGNEIKHFYKQIRLLKLEKRTKGAAETVFAGLNQLNDYELDKKTIIVDCDTFYIYDILDKFRNQTDNAVFCFVDMLQNPIYSYVNIGSNHLVVDIKEKDKISNYANTGCYCFSNGHLLKEYCSNVLDDFELGHHPQSELYISGVIKKMISNKHIFRANIISEDDFHCLGTPIQVKIFCEEHCKKFTKNNKLRICFDLDNTLVSYPEINGDYTTVKPIMKNIKICRYLKYLGHYIIIYTARRMKTHSGNMGKCIADIGVITYETLNKFNIPYDELYFGKPHANFYIDDLCINSNMDVERELGFYITNVAERDFNNIVVKSDNIITKKGHTDKIKGEIFWYNNIPQKIKHLFPIMYSFSQLYDSYDMEKIGGITISYLYTTESMSNKILLNYLETIEMIHSSCDCNANINIYANYKNKIMKRYNSYNYSKFPNSTNVYSKLIEYFDKYENEKMGCISVIHGDPVFSNCILNEYGQFKFIDMRGLLDETETIFGDKLYDYGKIYQSIIGYDEILLDKFLSIDYKTNMINTFEKFIIDKFDSETLNKIKMITNSLLFTLIPLHDNDKCEKYYNLIKL